MLEHVTRVINIHRVSSLVKPLFYELGMYRCIGFGIGSIGAFLGYRYR